MRNRAAVEEENTTLDTSTHIAVRPLAGSKPAKVGQRLDLTMSRTATVQALEAQGVLQRLPLGSPEQELAKQGERIRRRRVEVEDRGRTAAAELAAARDDLIRVVADLEVAELAAARLDALKRERKGAENKVEMFKRRAAEVAEETEALS